MAAKPVHKEDKKSVAKPDWAQDMPSEAAGESALELQRRIEKGPLVRVRAVVEVFHPVALESFSLNGSADVHVAGTSVKILTPQKFEGLKLLVHHDSLPDQASCWRVPGCQADFDLYERLLEARQAGMHNLWFIYVSSLKNITLVPPASQGNKVRRSTRGNTNR